MTMPPGEGKVEGATPYLAIAGPLAELAGARNAVSLQGKGSSTLAGVIPHSRSQRADRAAVAGMPHVVTAYSDSVARPDHICATPRSPDADTVNRFRRHRQSVHCRPPTDDAQNIVRILRHALVANGEEKYSVAVPAAAVLVPTAPGRPVALVGRPCRSGCRLLLHPRLLPPLILLFRCKRGSGITDQLFTLSLVGLVHLPSTSFHSG